MVTCPVSGAPVLLLFPSRQIQQAHAVLADPRRRQLYHQWAIDELSIVADVSVASAVTRWSAIAQLELSEAEEQQCADSSSTVDWAAEGSSATTGFSLKSGISPQSFLSQCCSPSSARNLANVAAMASACIRAAFNPPPLSLPPTELPSSLPGVELGTRSTAALFLPKQKDVDGVQNNSDGEDDSDSTPTLILLHSPSSSRSLHFYPTWHALQPALHPMLALAHLDISAHPHTALPLLPVDCLTGSPSFPSGLPLLLAKAPSCHSAACLLPFQPTRAAATRAGALLFLNASLEVVQGPPPPFFSAVLEWVASYVLRLPPVPILPLPQLKKKLFREPPEFKTRVLLLLGPGQGVPLAALYWQARAKETSAWAAVRWSEESAHLWEKGWRAQGLRAPAVGVYRDPGLPVKVFTGENPWEYFLF